MKQLFYFTILITITLSLNAQVGDKIILSLITADSIALDFSDNDIIIENNRKIKSNESVSPLFPPYGDYDITFYPELFDSLVGFIKNNLTYPDSSNKAGVEGYVLASFIINGDGSMSDIVIRKGLNSEIDAEILRVFSIMPKWVWWKTYKPREMQKMEFILPIKFTLED